MSLLLGAIADAFYATEKLEETAKLFLLPQARRIKPLDADQVAELKTRFPVEI